jgi:hypothetical protein
VIRRGALSFAPLACVFATLGVAYDAAADEESVDDLLRRGVALRREHRNEDALAVFQEILARAPTPSARAQLALAEQAIGRWIAAERDLDAALSVDDDKWIAKNRAALEGARTVIEAHLAWATVNVDVAGASITLAGESVASGVEARVAAGDVVVDVRADARLPAHRVVRIAPAEHSVITIALDPAAAPTPSAGPIDCPVPPLATPPATPRAFARSSPAGPLVLGAVGLAGLATGVYFGVRTMDFKSERDGACVNGCLPSAAGYDSSARSSAAASTVAFGVGAGFVAAGVVWWLVGRGHAGVSHPAVEVAPIVGAGAGGLVVQGDL